MHNSYMHSIFDILQPSIVWNNYRIQRNEEHRANVLDQSYHLNRKLRIVYFNCQYIDHRMSYM